MTYRSFLPLPCSTRMTIRPLSHRMGRNYLKGRDGDRINAVLAAAGYNFSLLLRWLERLLRALIRALLALTLRLQAA